MEWYIIPALIGVGFSPEEAGTLKIFKGKGCNHCNKTGYKGRVGIFELLIVNEEMRSLIAGKATSESIKKKAVETGTRLLKDDGIDKVLKGITTLEEVLKATQEE